MKKWILRIVVVVLVLVLGTAGVVWGMLDSIAKKGIQQGGEYALGVKTDVNDVKLSLINGTLMIDNLKVSNPEGFKSPHLMKTGRFDLEVAPGSVVNSPVEVKQFVLDGLDVNIEQTAKGNNISAILDHVKKLAPPADASQKETPKDNSEGRKMKIGKLVIKNVVAHVTLPVPAVVGKELTIKLPAIEIDDVSKDCPDGITISTLVSRIVPALLASIVKEGKDIIPTDLSGVLNSDLASAAQAMGGHASKMLEQVGGDASKMLKTNLDKGLKDATKGLGNVGKGTGDLGKGVGDALKGVIPGTPKK